MIDRGEDAVSDNLLVVLDRLGDAGRDSCVMKDDKADVNKSEACRPVISTSLARTVVLSVWKGFVLVLVASLSTGGMSMLSISKQNTTSPKLLV